MPIENDPVSSILRKIIRDHATIKLFTIVFSVILIVVSAGRVRKEWHMIVLLVIYGSSLIYSILALLVVIFKKQEEIGESKFMKKIFGGRKVFWHEIQTCVTFTLAILQLSGITMAFAGEIYRTEIHMIFSILNCFFFMFEFYAASKSAKNYVLEQNFNGTRNCFAILLGPFYCFPMFFNILRNTCFIVSAVLIAKSRLLSYMNVYYFHCMAFAIIASFILFVSQIYQACKTRNSSTLSTCGRKWQTLFLLIIAIHVFLAVLSLSMISGYNTDTKVEVKASRIDYNHIQYSNHHRITSKGTYENSNDTHARQNLGTNNSNNMTVENMEGSTTPPTPTDPLPTMWYTSGWYHEIYYAPTEVPIPFALTCLAFVLSFLELYSRAIRSQSNPRLSGYSNNITIPENPDFAEALHNHDGITKIEDLPIVVAAPHHFTDPRKA